MTNKKLKGKKEVITMTAQAMMKKKKNPLKKWNQTQMPRMQSSSVIIKQPQQLITLSLMNRKVCCSMKSKLKLALKKNHRPLSRKRQSIKESRVKKKKPLTTSSESKGIKINMKKRRMKKMTLMRMTLIASLRTL
jgi:hypothetical protein